MSFFCPPIPRCTPYTRPYKTCAACSSPFTTLSRTPAHDASFEGMILMPYFSSNFITEAITTEAQSVSGIKPTLTSLSSGASEPPAQAAERVPIGTIDMIPAMPSIEPACFIKSLRLFCSGAASSTATDFSAVTISDFWFSITCSPLIKIRLSKAHNKKGVRCVVTQQDTFVFDSITPNRRWLVDGYY